MDLGEDKKTIIPPPLDLIIDPPSPLLEGQQSNPEWKCEGRILQIHSQPLPWAHPRKQYNNEIWKHEPVLLLIHVLILYSVR